MVEHQMPRHAASGKLIQAVVVFLVCLSLCHSGWAAALSDPEVDRYNVRVGTQTFSPRYQFTGETELVETAEAIHAMGSDIVKFAMGKLYAGQYNITLPGSINSLSALARNEPSCRRVLDMPFRHYLLWVYTFASNGNDKWWADGYSASERQSEYNEVYAFAQCLLTNYNNSGKSFYFGHWEGDWYLISPDNTGVNPSPVAIQGMVDWLNNRQQAVDDALRDTPHTNVFIFHYAEANRVRDAMENPPGSNQRVVNAVLPQVTNIDYVSWSAYDGMHLATADLHNTLNYIESNLPTNKAARIPGKRIILGEYGWGGTLSSAAQEAPTRGFIQKVLAWGAPFILFWQMYDNEGHSYWLIDNTNSKTPCYFLHQWLINKARLLVAQFRESNGRVPTAVEFSSMTAPLLDQPLSAPVNLVVSNLPLSSLSATSAVMQARVGQGIYGSEQASVSVFWGTQDGAANPDNWEHRMFIGINTNYNPVTFSAGLTNLLPGKNYYFRFYATNGTGEAWAPSSLRFSTDVLKTNDFGSRMRIAVNGYVGDEPLTDFPLLVKFNSSDVGFSYRQFASGTGADLRFTDATGTQPIYHEIDEWNTNGTSCVWVRVPFLAGSNDCIWAYWGNPLATNFPAYTTNGSAWSQAHELVWHMRESALPFRDSTLKHHGSVGVAPSTTTGGVIGRGNVFNGFSHYLNAGLVNVGDQFTLSAWVRVDAAANSIQTVWANKAGGSSTPGFSFFVNSWGTKDGKSLLETGNGANAAYAGTDTNVVPVGTWKHVAAVIDRPAGKASLYINGIDRTVSEAVRTDFPTLTNVYLGRFSSPDYYFRGMMDEVRIETVKRSSNWLWAAAMNVASNSSFVTFSLPSRRTAAVAAELGANGVSLRWPAPAVGFTLQLATNLQPPIAWSTVTNRPVLLSNEWNLVLGVTNGAGQYYRLHSP